ncbi:hypothetical protein D3C72_952180 [compost metagenome]
MLQRREAHEQRVVAQAFVDGAGAVMAAAQAEHLGGAGFTGRLVGRVGERAARRTGSHHVSHGVLDHVHVGLLERNAVVGHGHRGLGDAGAGITHRVHQVRPPVQPIVGQGRGALRQLQQGE